MQLNWLFLILLSGGILKCQNFPVTFTVQQIIPYCGGAAPDKQISQNNRTSAPYANKTLYLITSKGKYISTVTSNAKGVFNLHLKTTGTFYLLEPWKYLKTGPYGDSTINYDQTCLNTEWKKPDVIITVSKGKNKVQSFIPETAPCFWQYPCALHREMPPAAKPH